MNVSETSCKVVTQTQQLYDFFNYYLHFMNVSETSCEVVTQTQQLYDFFNYYLHAMNVSETSCKHNNFSVTRL